MSSLIVEICKVVKVEHHPNADKLDVVQIKGWNCIVGRDQCKEGQLVIFVPPDAIMPQELIDMYKLTFLKKNGRVDTIKLRGVVSQGLVLDPLPLVLQKKIDVKEGRDVADVLGIVKYEPPEPSFQGTSVKQVSRKKSNPLFDVYTDIQNIKHYPDIFKNEDEVVVTEKIHGTNFRVGKLIRPTTTLWQRIVAKIFGKYEFVYGSHRVQITNHGAGRKSFYSTDVYGYIAKKYNLAEIIPEDYILYGEIYGTLPSGKKLQENYDYGRTDDVEVVFFDVKYKGQYLGWEEFRSICFRLQLPTVPVLYRGDYGFVKENAKRFVEGESVLFPGQAIREGCVIKPVREQIQLPLGRKILKCINPEYLLLKNNTDFH
jgi:RNA ligase (TIGR02306 family)